MAVAGLVGIIRWEMQEVSWVAVAEAKVHHQEATARRCIIYFCI
jgi:hypothetical protein